MDYSRIVKPLNNLKAGYPPLHRGAKKKKKETDDYHNPKESFGNRWTPDCQQAFETIIKKLTSARPGFC